jgi:cytochrome c biogenesis protein CcmG/thiol:disulfide interchange protein DsbE
VNFWASWCKPCQEEAPILARFARQLKPRRAVLIGIDITDKHADALRFIQRFEIKYPNVTDRGDRLLAAFRLIGLPSTYAIDASGRVAWRHVGPVTTRQLRRVLDALLREPRS